MLKRFRTYAVAGLFGLACFGTCCGAQAAAGQAEPQTKHLRISGGVMAGQILTKVNPTYPEDAKAQHISGTVVMRAVIGTEGLIKGLEVVSGPDVLRDAALEAVRQWTYKPYLLNGQPVEVDTTIVVNFTLVDPHA